jgi:hypothetical protein
MDVQLIQCHTAKELLEELNPTLPRWLDETGWKSKFIFRGHANADWLLIPKALRLGNEQMKFARQQVFIEELHEIATQIQSMHASVGQKYHFDYIQECLTQGFAEIINLQEFYELAESLNLSGSLPVKSEFQQLDSQFARDYFTKTALEDYWSKPEVAIAQHHGMATRLLDWTTNPLYAAFFATEDAGKENGDYIAVYAADALGSRVDVSVRHSPYIRSQSGVFTLDRLANHEYMQTGRWRSFLEIEHGKIYKLTLPRHQVNELVRLLWVHRITKAHMMPSLDNVIHALNSRRRLEITNR